MARRDSTREIQSIERQVMTPNIQVRSNNAAATVGEATSELGYLLANKLQEQAVYQSGLAGQKAAEEGRAPKNLMYPVTKATAAYNQAVINTEARNLATQGESMISEAYVKFANPATFNEQTPAQFNAAIDGITQGVLDATRPENRGIVKNALDQVTSRARVKMLDDAIKYDNQQTEIQFNRDLALGVEILNNASLGKDPEEIKIAQNYVDGILSDYAIINQGIANKLPDIRKKIDDQLKINSVVAEYIDAYSQGQKQAIAFINDLATKKFEGLTAEQQISATAQVLKLHQQNVRLTAEHQNEIYQGMSLKIDADMVQSPQDITQEIGDDLPTSDVYQLQRQWVNHNRAKNKALQAETIVLQARKGGPQEVAKLPNQVLNDYYAYREKTILEEINSNLAPNEPYKQQLSLTEKMQFVVAPAGAPIQDYNIDLSYGLKSADPAIALDALNAYRYGWEHRNEFGDVLKGLDSQADQIAQYVISLGDKSEVETLQLIGQAQANLNDKSDTTRQARTDRLKTFYTGAYGKRQIDGYYKQAFGVTPGRPEFDASFGEFQGLFDYYFMGVADGNAEVSLKMAQAEMRDWGTSKWGAPDDNMYSPPEKTIAFTDMGYWFDNQVGLALNKTLKNLEEQGSNIKRPTWMKKQIPEGEVSEQDLFSKNYLSTTREAAPQPGSAGSLFVTDAMLNEEGIFKRELTAVVDGIERRIYLTSTQDTRQSITGEPVYQFYYNDDFGVAQYLPNPYNPLGVAQFTAKSMGQFIPEVYDELRDEDFDKVAKKYARGEFNTKNPESWYDRFIPGQTTKRSIDELIYIRDNMERIKKEFKEENEGKQ